MRICRFKYRYFFEKKIKKVNICSLDNLTRKGSKQNSRRLLNHNIKNFKINIEKFEKIKATSKFDLIIDCCAEPAIEVSKKEPDRVFNTNLIGTFNILKKCINDKANIIFCLQVEFTLLKLRSLVKNLNIKKPLKIRTKIAEKFETGQQAHYMVLQK